MKLICLYKKSISEYIENLFIYSSSRYSHFNYSFFILVIIIYFSISLSFFL